jgi:hypothetical protein
MLGNLRLSLLEGDIQIKTVDLGDWSPASINLPLREGDELWIPESGRLEVQILPATYVRLDQTSSLAVVTVTKGAEQLYLTQGRAYIHFNPAQGGMLQIDTPISSTQIYDRAVFRIDVTEQGYTDVSVLDGAVYVESQGGKTTVEADNVLSLREGADAELTPLGPVDDWENWNVERDKRVFAVRESGRYLPPEIRGYASDLDANGKWVYVKEYGQVWTPSVVVSPEWSPYRVGRWTWVGGDYVWVSYEPWGWAPYHYGRWAHAAGIGWFWVPPVTGRVYWGPGFVGWVNTPDYVAWVPLAPREIYYGYGYFGPDSVDIRRVNINSIRITNIYRNVYVNNSVTIINHNTFIHGHGWGGRLPESPMRYTDTGLRGNPFLENRIHAGRPLINPVRSSMVSVNREISATRLPPQRIREMNITNIRDSRHIVRDPGVSAFTPGAKTRDLPVRQVEGARRGGPGVGGPKEGVKVDRSPRVGGPKEGVKVDRSPGVGGPKEGVKVDRGPGIGGPREGVKIDRGPGVGGPKEGVKVDRSPGIGGPREGVKIDRSPGVGGPKEGVKIDRGPGVGGKKEGVKTGGPGGPGGPEPKTGPVEKPK